MFCKYYTFNYYNFHHPHNINSYAKFYFYLQGPGKDFNLPKLVQLMKILKPSCPDPQANSLFQMIEHKQKLFLTLKDLTVGKLPRFHQLIQLPGSQWSQIIAFSEKLLIIFYPRH